MGDTKMTEFDSIYYEFVDSIFQYFLVRLNNREDAKDLTQEAFFNFWNYYIKNNKEVKNRKSLLFTIAHNLLVNKYERTKKTQSLDAMMEENGFDSLDENSTQRIIDQADGRILNERLVDLDPKDREILNLRYYQDLSVKEVAKIMKQSENSISVKIHRIIEKLKKNMNNKK